MNTNRAYTLIEIMVVMVIMSILAVIIVVNVFKSYEQTRAQGGMNNLYAIAAAQSKFNEDYGPNVYCINTLVPPSGLTALCGDTTIDLSANLHLGLSVGDPFNIPASNSYSCTVRSVSDPANALYHCTATDGTVTLDLVGLPQGADVTCTGTNCPS